MSQGSNCTIQPCRPVARAIWRGLQAWLVCMAGFITSCGLTQVQAPAMWRFTRMVISPAICDVCGHMAAQSAGPGHHLDVHVLHACGAMHFICFSCCTKCEHFWGHSKKCSKTDVHNSWAKGQTAQYNHAGLWPGTIWRGLHAWLVSVAPPTRFWSQPHISSFFTQRVYLEICFVVFTYIYI